MIGIKPEVIQCTEANRVGVLIGRKSFRAPCDKLWIRDNIPRCAAIPGISLCAIMRKPWMLRWRMEPDIGNIHSRSYGHAEILNSTIEVLIINRIFIVPDACIRTCHFVADEENAVASWRGPRGWLDWIAHRRAA